MNSTINLKTILISFIFCIGCQKSSQMETPYALLTIFDYTGSVATQDKEDYARISDVVLDKFSILRGDQIGTSFINSNSSDQRTFLFNYKKKTRSFDNATAKYNNASFAKYAKEVKEKLKLSEGSGSSDVYGALSHASDFFRSIDYNDSTFNKVLIICSDGQHNTSDRAQIIPQGLNNVSVLWLGLSGAGLENKSYIEEILKEFGCLSTRLTGRNGIEMFISGNLKI